MPHTHVVHCKRAKYDVYVGRKSRGAPAGTTGEWGNPFTMKNGSTTERQRVIEEYEAWLLQQSDLVQKAKLELRGKVLACWCAPKACHADILARVANDCSASEMDDGSYQDEHAPRHALQAPI